MGPLESIGISFSSLIAYLINFLILFALLAFLGYRPIMRMLDQRSNKIKESMEQAEQIRGKSLRTEEEVKIKLDEGRREGQVIIAQAAQMGERVKEEARQEARREAENLIAKARLEIQRERGESIEQLRQEFVDLAIFAAEKVINESLDKEAHQRLIEEVLEESTSLRE
jgi:F-type H+-transporting ATPase subunit b